MTDRGGPSAVFLDRDGVLNASFRVDGVPTPPRSVDQLELLPGVEEACRTLAEAGLLLVVVTNQPDLSRGTLAPADLDLIHQRLRETLPIHDIRVCPHDDADDCACRKPRPGLVLDAARDHGIDLSRSVLVGDRWRDIDAAASAGVRSVYVDSGSPEPLRSLPDSTFASLQAALDHILSVTGVTR